MKKFILWLDPYKQSPFFFRPGIIGILLIVLAAGALAWYYSSPQLQPGGYMPRSFFTNPFTGLPNFLFHEFGHRLACGFSGRWFCVFSGTFFELGAPLAAYFGLLRLNGGRYFLPLITLWLSTALYSVGAYAYYGSSKELALASSDMVSNAKAGTAYGDWYEILTPLGLLQYDKIIGNAIIILACLCLVITLYSVYYYIAKDSQYPLNPQNRPESDYETPPTHFDNIYKG